LAPGRWRQNIDAEAFSSDRPYAGDYAFACSWVIVGAFIAADSSSPGHHRRFFVGGLFAYLFPRIEGRPMRRGARRFALLVSN
jgi:hypothetical protein